MSYANQICFISLFNNLVHFHTAPAPLQLILIALMLLLSPVMKFLSKDIFGTFLWAVSANGLPSLYFLSFFLNSKSLIFYSTATYSGNKLHFSASLTSPCGHTIKFWPVGGKQCAVCDTFLTAP